jgi:predicted AlkP superfamily phosphohydrolase/phosphomutase
MRTPVVVIGLDGATFEWLRPLAKEGLIPNLSALMDGGSAAPLISTMPPLTPPGWATCLTGVSPRLHGLWDFVRRRSAHRYELLPTSGADVRAPWLWNRLDRRERRSIVLSLPFTYPARPLNGRMVCGFDSTDRKRAAYPAHLLDELEVSLEGPYPFFYQTPARHIRKLFPNADDAIRVGDEQRSNLADVVAESRRFTRDKLRAASILAEREPFDFLFVHVFETDHLAHEAWPAIADPEHPDHGLLAGYFQELDEGIGRLVESCYRWEEPVVMLVSDHGFGPCRRRLLLNDWLVKEGLLVLRDAARPNQPEAAAWDRIDWRRTRAYAIQTGIYFNTARFHPEGIVSEAELEPLTREVVARLRSELGDGAYALRVAPRDAIATSTRPELAPDLVVHLDSDVCAMGYGELHGTVWAEAGGLQGYHRMHGICVASGPGIRAGQTFAPVHMVDIAPTLLHLMGIADRDGLEGRVLSELLDNTRAVEVTAGSATRAAEGRDGGAIRAAEGFAGSATPGAWTSIPSDDAGAPVEPEDVEEITRRLAALGYMG